MRNISHVSLTFIYFRNTNQLTNGQILMQYPVVEQIEPSYIVCVDPCVMMHVDRFQGLLPFNTQPGSSCAGKQLVADEHPVADSTTDSAGSDLAVSLEMLCLNRRGLTCRGLRCSFSDRHFYAELFTDSLLSSRRCFQNLLRHAKQNCHVVFKPPCRNPAEEKTNRGAFFDSRCSWA